MKITTTLDPELQAAAESAAAKIAYVGPAVSIVTIENATGEVKAMVGGESFRDKPFNLATNGHRQPGSAFKPFILLAALETGDYGPGSVFSSQPKDLPFINKNGDKDLFHVSNYEDQYLGSASLTTATAQSDNSVYAELGMQVGRDKVAERRTTWGSRPSCRRTRRCSSAAWRRASRRSRWRSPTRPSRTAATGSAREWASYKCGPVAIKGVDGRGQAGARDRGGLLAGGGGHGEDDAELRDLVRHRHAGAGRRVRRRQDRHDRELRRRLVLRLHRQVHDVRVDRATRTRSSPWRPSTAAARWRAAPGRP